MDLYRLFKDKKMKFIPVILLSPVLALNAYADIFEPAPIKVTDGFSITPQISTSVRYDDNIYSETDQATSSSIYLLNPSFKFGVDDGINRYGGTYTLNSGSYSNGSEDNYIDHNLSLLAHTEYTDRHRTDFKFSYANLHEDRGSGLSEGDSTSYDEPLKYNELNVRGYYQYGGMTSLMRVGGGVDFNNISYQNFTSTTKYDDYSRLKLFADADYQVASVTFLTFDVSSSNIEYKYLEPGENSSDNQDSSALIGFKWAGLSKTTVIAKAGYQYKTFDSNERENFSGNTVVLGVTWKPREYSTFTAAFSRAAEDSSTDGDYILALDSSLGWKHEWTEDFNSNIRLIYTDEDYIGFARSDKTKNLVLSLNYDLTRWIQINAGYEFTDTDSTETGISYDKNAVNLGVVVAL